MHDGIDYYHWYNVGLKLYTDAEDCKLMLTSVNTIAIMAKQVLKIWALKTTYTYTENDKRMIKTNKPNTLAVKYVMKALAKEMT